MRFKKGFTIVEVLVVIAIIAILTAIILPSLNNIRAKNRDTERVADIAAIQLALSLYKSQNLNNEYPATLEQPDFQKYITVDSKTPPTTDINFTYKYVPLKGASAVGNRCTYYHLGTKLELQSGQIDTADTFDSTGGEGGVEIKSGGYKWCGTYGNNAGETGIATGTTQYNVHP